jgi:hypothetical protein
MMAWLNGSMAEDGKVRCHTEGKEEENGVGKTAYEKEGKEKKIKNKICYTERKEITSSFASLRFTSLRCANTCEWLKVLLLLLLLGIHKDQILSKMFTANLTSIYLQYFNQSM